MRYQVPQFVDIEDKIIGPLTLKQFLIYVSAVLVLIPAYLFSDLSLFLTVSLPVGGIAVAFAHWKINGRSLAAILADGFQFYISGQLYIWQRTDDPKILTVKDSEWEELLYARKAAKADLSALAITAQSLETEGHILDADEVDPFVPEGE